MLSGTLIAWQVDHHAPEGEAHECLACKDDIAVGQDDLHEDPELLGLWAQGLARIAISRVVEGVPKDEPSNLKVCYYKGIESVERTFNCKGILRRGHDDYRKNIFEGIYSKKGRLNVQPKLNRGLAQQCIDFRFLGEVNTGEHEYDLE